MQVGSKKAQPEMQWKAEALCAGLCGLGGKERPVGPWAGLMPIYRICLSAPSNVRQLMYDIHSSRKITIIQTTLGAWQAHPW